MRAWETPRISHQVTWLYRQGQQAAWLYRQQALLLAASQVPEPAGSVATWGDSVVPPPRPPTPPLPPLLVVVVVLLLAPSPLLLWHRQPLLLWGLSEGKRFWGASAGGSQAPPPAQGGDGRRGWKQGQP